MSEVPPLPSVHSRALASGLAEVAVSRSGSVPACRRAVARALAPLAARARSRQRTPRPSPTERKSVSCGATNSVRAGVRTFVVLDAPSLVRKALVLAFVAGDDFDRVRRRGRWRCCLDDSFLRSRSWSAARKKIGLEHRGRFDALRIHRIAQRELNLALRARHREPRSIFRRNEQRDHWHRLRFAFTVLLDLLSRRKHADIFQNRPRDRVFLVAIRPGQF